MTYFDARELPEPTSEYVAWVDVMGIQSHMARSIAVAANFVFKLHVAALDSPNKGAITLYPVMDGFYATSNTRKGIESFLRDVLLALATVFSEEGKPHFQFIVRGAIAFGKVYHGRSIRDAASKRLTENPNYRAAILLGEPIVDAHKTESVAPPFGIAIHGSAREQAAAGEAVFPDEWWRWFPEKFDRDGFRLRLATYYKWCRSEHRSILYDLDRMAIHEGLGNRYFG